MIALLAIVGMVPQRVISVDLIEDNTYYHDGELQFEQIILWEWSPDYRRLDVLDWWLVRDDELSARDVPLRVGQLWKIVHFGTTIQSACFRRTATDFDPELRQRQLMPDAIRNRRLK